MPSSWTPKVDNSQTFYNKVTQPVRSTINAIACSALMNKMDDVPTNWSMRWHLIVTNGSMREANLRGFKVSWNLMLLYILQK